MIDEDVASRFWNAIFSAHDRDAYQLSVVSLGPSDTLGAQASKHGIKAFALGHSVRAGGLAALFPLASLVRRLRPDIIHAHTFAGTLTSLIVAKTFGVRCLFTRHHSDHILRLNRPIHQAIDAWCARNADHVFAVSHSVREIVIDSGVAPSRVTTVYNGIELPTEVPAPRARSRHASPVLLCVARLHEEKGHAYLLQAMTGVLSEIGPLTLWVVGTGPERQRIEDIARGLGIADHVQILGHRADVLALMRRADLLVLPSLVESFGMVLVEAMSVGTPVVASRVGGVPEVVIDEESGLLVPRADSPALTSAILRLLFDDDLYTRLSSGGLVNARRFAAKTMVECYESFYRKICLGD